jgi:hypothetical protein
MDEDEILAGMEDQDRMMREWRVVVEFDRDGETIREWLGFDEHKRAIRYLTRVRESEPGSSVWLERRDVTDWERVDS